MAFFKKQRLRYQEWLNSFIVKHHDEWYMPLITIGLGLSYLVLALLILFISMILIACIHIFIGDWVFWTVVAVGVLYVIGIIVRVPGDCDYDRKQNDHYIH